MAIHFIGYTLDSVVESARAKINNPGENVILHVNGVLGEPLDRYHDLVSEKYAVALSAMCPGIEFSMYKNPRYLFIPYKLVKVANRENGVFHFPLSRASFCDQAEYEEIAEAYRKANLDDVIADNSTTPSKLISDVVAALPDKFGATFKRALTNVRWRGLQISKMAMHGYRYEYPLDKLVTDNDEYYCRPMITYREICELLAKRYGVEIEYNTSSEVSDMIADRSYSNLTVMDNRIDMYMGYMCGRFDRAVIKTAEVKIPAQIKFGSDGLYYTPLAKCWGVMVFDEHAYRLDSEMYTGLHDIPISELPSTRGNMKMYDTYQTTIKLYGHGKSVDLGQRIETMVK